MNVCTNFHGNPVVDEIFQPILVQTGGSHVEPHHQQTGEMVSKWLACMTFNLKAVDFRPYLQ